MSMRRPAASAAPPAAGTPLRAVLSAGVAHRQAANVSVNVADHKKIVEWASDKPEFAQEAWNGYFLLKAVVARCEERFGDEGVDKVDAAIVHYADMLDVLTFFQRREANARDPVIQRVQRAFFVDAAEKAALTDAQTYLALAEKQKRQDAEQAPLKCDGGGKCKMSLQTSRGAKREADGGPSYEQLFPQDNIDYYNGVVDRVLKKGYKFPSSLW